MPREWTSSPDLHLDLDVPATGGRRAALERALRDAIHASRLAPGTALPSSRRLAHDLGLSRGTVVDAYAQLTSEGYLVAQPGGSTRVTATPSAPPRAAAAGVPRTRDVARFDLRPGLLDLATTFPRADWMKVLRAVMSRAPDSAFDYGDPRGLPELRNALAAYLARARGVVCRADDVVICRGFAHGLGLFAAATRAMGGRTMAMEDPCLPPHRDIVERAGLRVARLPVDAQGADPSALTGVDAAVVTPAHQYPTGVTLHPARRADLVAWARRTGGLIVEDDYDGEFRYDRQPVGALQGLAPDHVTYVGTTSKTLAPGLRVGWMVVPQQLMASVLAVMGPQPGGDGPPALEQLALAEFIERGLLDRHLRRLRAGYRQRRDVVVRALATMRPPIPTVGIAAGLHVLVDFTGTPFTEQRVAAAARARSVRVTRLGPHRHAAGDGPGGIVLGFARPPQPQLAKAMATLRTAMKESLDDPD